MPPSWFSYSAMDVLMVFLPLVLDGFGILGLGIETPISFFYGCFFYILTLKSYSSVLFVLRHLKLRLKSLTFVSKH